MRTGDCTCRYSTTQAARRGPTLRPAPKAPSTSFSLRKPKVNCCPIRIWKGAVLEHQWPITGRFTFRLLDIFIVGANLGKTLVWLHQSKKRPGQKQGKPLPSR